MEQISRRKAQKLTGALRAVGAAFAEYMVDPDPQKHMWLLQALTKYEDARRA